MAEKPGKPGGRAGMTQVEINACWVEACRKENKGRILKEQFDFNPKNLIAITEKPTRMGAAAAQNDKNTKTTEEDLKLLKEKLDSLKRVPKSKFNLPMTSNQEVGWDMDTDMNGHLPVRQLNRKLC